MVTGNEEWITYGNMVNKHGADKPGLKDRKPSKFGQKEINVFHEDNGRPHKSIVIH